MRICYHLLLLIFIFSYLLPQTLYGQHFYQKQYLTSYEPDYRDLYGMSVYISGDTVVISAPGESLNGSGINQKNGAGACYIYTMDQDSIWNLKQKITHSDRENDDRFGNKVSISDDLLLIGAKWSDLDQNQTNFLLEAGSVYLFEKNSSGNYTEKQKLIASDRAAKDEFGWNLIIENDLAVISSYNNLDTVGLNSLKNTGSVYVFEKNLSGLFIEKQKLIAIDRDTNQIFGKSILISQDNQIFVGYNSNLNEFGANFLPSAGAVLIYDRNSSGKWIITGKLVASDRKAGDLFGESIAISGDYLAVSAPNKDYDINGNNFIANSGIVYVFKKDNFGKWTEVGKVTANKREYDVSFGSSLSMDGELLVVGSAFNSTDENNQDSIPHSGALHLYKRNSSGKYEYLQKLVAQPRKADSGFGYNVDIDGFNIFSGSFYDKVNSISWAGSCSFFTTNDTNVSSVENYPSKNQHVQILLYPNPNSGNFHLRTDRYVSGNIAVYNNLGELIFKQDFNGYNAFINLPNQISSGVYMLRIETDKNSSGISFILSE